MKGNSKPIIVTGMHRSGTSLTASLLSALGVDMGRELLPPDKNNQRGYFEDIDFLDFQREILSQSCPPNDNGQKDWGWTESEQLNRENLKNFIPSAKSLIASRAEKKGLWGWKDPRTTILLDFWDELLDDVYYVLVYRFPWDVADSLQRIGAPIFLRNPEYAYRIWHFYNRHLLDFYNRNSERCLLLSINALRQNPNRLVELLQSKLNVEISKTNLNKIYERELFSSSEINDPLIDLVAATSPQCTELLQQLDGAADLSGAELWQARPLRSRLKEENNSSSIDTSIIVTCFDDGQFLIEAIASFERVAPPNSEIVIINDGSKEPRTLEILKVLEDAGYFIIHQENQGLSVARNAGIKLAKGRFIFPFDADNRLRAGFIESAVETFDSSPETGVVYGYHQWFGMKTHLEEVAEFDLDKLLEFNYITACSMIRKQVWADCGGYDQRMTPCEDWEMWINAAEKGWRFQRLPQVAFDYRARPKSLLSMVNDADFLDQMLESIITKHYELYEPRFVKQLAQMKRRCSHLTMNLRSLTEDNQKQKAENDLLWSELSAANPDAVERMRKRHLMKNMQVGGIDNSRGMRLLNYARRIKQKVRQLLTLRKGL